MSNVPLSIVVGGSFLFSPMSPLAFPAAVLAEETPAFRLLRALFGLDTLFLLAPVYFVLADAQARSRTRAR